MHEEHVLVNVTGAIVAALLGGLAARLLRLPLLVGYLLAGIAVGPHTPGFFANEESVRPVAHLGVALLMFAVGVQFHLRELVALRRIALLGGGGQIVATIVLGWGVAQWLGWSHYTGIFLGCALALSSTAVMMRVLEERGELGTAHGSAMLAVLITQDLVVVLMAILLPSLATLSTEGSAVLAGVGLSLLRAVGSVAATLILAMRVVPAILDQVARRGSQELFLLVVVSMCLVAALLAGFAGLSLELGAFLAGLVISESDYAHEAFSQVRPLRDVFASLFFVSVGMLLNPLFVFNEWALVLTVVLTIVLGKGLIATVALFAVGLHGRTCLLAGLGLAQIGEFSFILASIGADRGLVESHVVDVIVASALITILAAPFVFSAAGPFYRRLNRAPAFSRLLNRQGRHEPLPPGATPDEPQVLILGCGRVGEYVSDALRLHGVRQVVVDYDALVVERLRRLGVPVVYGDATSEIVLARAEPPCVELAVVALPEAAMTQMAVSLLKRRRPGVPVLARVHRASDIGRVRRAGADAVFYAEFEAALAVVRDVLAALDFDRERIEEYLRATREKRFSADQ